MPVRRLLQPLMIVIVSLSWSSAAAQEPLTITVPKALTSADQAHTDIFAKFSAAVVGISARGTTASGQASGFTGTGTIITAKGLVLTSTTVIPADATDIKIYLTSGRIYAASIEAHDPTTESVLLQIAEAPARLTHMPLARSADCQVGDPVYSWGNPNLTIQRDGKVSLSVGGISGIYQTASVDDQSRYIGPVIEVDAAVNPGSDGGPITDRAGNLIGMMSLAFSPTRWLGLAIPTDHIRANQAKLKDIRPAKLAPPTSTDKLAWATTFALQKAAKDKGDAVVGIYAFRKGDREQAPEHRSKQELQERQAYPARQRANYERLQGAYGISSGFLVDASGIVITSTFNVKPATFSRIARDKKGRIGRATIKREVEALWVYTKSGERYAAEIVAMEDSYNLAVLKLKDTKGKKFPHFDLSAGSPVAQGGAVAVLGRSEPPGSLQLNSGSISAVNRVKGLVLQFSAMVNYGNLGGPVIDVQGRLVGMASHLNSRTSWRQNCGVGFCVRATHLAKAVPLLRQGKKPKAIKRSSIGVTINPDPDEDIEGVLVQAVNEKGTAAKAGLQVGDVVTSVGEQSVSDFITFSNLILQSEIGSTLTLTIERDGEEQSLSVTVGAE